MKKLRVLCILIILCATSVLVAQSKRAVDKGGFQIENGKVIVEGEVFDSMEDYQLSSKFMLEGRRCKTTAVATTTSSFLAPSDCSNSQTVIDPIYYPSQAMTVQVVFHIIIDSDGTTGDIPDSLIESQVDILNEDFGALSGTPGSAGFDTGIRFELAGITRTVNRQWFNDRRETQYKEATGWDRTKYLNIWTNSAGGYLGYAYLPDGSAGEVWDGVVLLYSVVGLNPPNAGIYNLGRTATHEVGHYFGLNHTFDGGCGDINAPYTTGDLIADTNPESTQHFDCVASNTCNTPDPIENYMNYTPDACMTEFTAEQGNRMVCSIMNYRADLTGGGDPPTGDFPLSASGYKVKGKQHADLSWSGAAGGSVDIYRDNVLIATAANNGAYTDNIGVSGGGTYTYQVCESGSSTCSNSATVAF